MPRAARGSSRARISSGTSSTTRSPIRATARRCSPRRAPATSGRRSSARPTAGGRGRRRRSRRRSSRAAAARSTTRSGSRPGHATRAGRLVRRHVAAGAVPLRPTAASTWAGVDGFNEHPQRKAWCGGDQDGTPDGPKLHSILVDPRDAAPPVHRHVERRRVRVDRRRRRLAAAEPRRASRLSCPIPTRSSATTRIACGCIRGDPDRLYQQNHCGIYRLDRPADALDRHRRGDAEIGRRDRLPDGPASARPGHAVGVSDGRHRTSGRASRPAGKPAAYRSVNGGKTWQRQATGLPKAQAWWTVKRQAMTADQAPTVGVYFGTTSGEVWGSRDEGPQLEMPGAAPAAHLRGRVRVSGVATPRDGPAADCRDAA